MKISLRTVDIRFELLNTQSMDGFNVIYQYMLYMLENFIKKNKDDMRTAIQEKNKLRTLKEKDPVLYDLKQYDRKAKVYSVLCQSDRQPSLYTPEEMKLLPNEKKNKLYKFWNFTTNQTAYYECASKAYPYLSYKIGKHPKGYCLPCCKKSLVMGDAFVNKMEKQCSETYSYNDYDNLSSHVLSYGKEIPVGRLGKLPPAVADPSLFLVGVHQNVPALNDAGVIYSIAAYFTDFFKNIAELVSSLSDFGIIGYGLGQKFESSMALADEILSVFENQIPGFSTLTLDEWIDVFMTLTKKVYNKGVVIYTITEAKNIEFSESADDIIIVVRNKSGAYPIFTNNIPLMLGVSSVGDDLIRSVIAMTKTPEDSRLNLLETLAKKGHWIPVYKLIDSRDLCYGMIFTKDNSNFVYFPVMYCLHENQFTDVEKITGARPKLSYPKSLLDDFLKDCKEQFKIEFEYYLRDFEGYYFGFKSGKLYYFFDRVDPISQTDSVLMPYDPAEIDRNIKCSRQILIENESILKLEYLNRIYRLMVGEFINIMKHEKNKIIRKKINSILDNVSFKSTASIQKFYESIDTLLADFPDDRHDIKTIASQFTDIRQMKVFVANTIFDFDYQRLHTIENDDPDAAFKKVKAIMDPVVLLVDSIENIKIDNIFVPCSNDRKHTTVSMSYCKGNKLKVLRDYYTPFLQILTDDVRKKTVMFTSNLFEYNTMIRRPEETIQIISG